MTDVGVPARAAYPRLRRGYKPRKDALGILLAADTVALVFKERYLDYVRTILVESTPSMCP